ncbi:MAG: hypothetical protein RBR22_04935 [Desulfuromonas sp.]|nr:hypothetical protein [Desulfuromonas sp.]
MQWVAYFIWAAVALCVGAIIVSFLYLRRQPATSSDKVEDDTAHVIPFNQHRWQLLLSRTPFNADDVPQGETERIAWAHELLGVEPEWFSGGDVAMYPCLSFHNAVGDSVDFIQQRLRENNKLRLYAVKPTGVVLTETAYEASVVLCFAAPVVYAGKSAWRYWPVNVYWEWGYLPEQMQCRQIIYAALHSGCEVVGVELDVADIYFLLESRLIPEPLYSISPDPNLATPDAQWDAIAVANAGEPVPGQIEETLSAADLQHRLENSSS